MSKSFARARSEHRSVDHGAARSARGAALLVVLGAALYGPAARAQVVPGTGAEIGTMAADRARIRQITGAAGDSTLRSDSLPTLHPVLPTVRFAWNSDLPAGGNDGALWAGRGASVSITAGVAYSRPMPGRRLDVVLAPEIDYSQNRPFSIFAGREPGRSPFSSPWHIGQASADLPLRFGDLSTRAIGLGQSSITLTTDRVAFGASASNEWWGPAIRNSLLLSNDAAGVPRLFVRTARPVHTRFGDFEGRAMIGGLTESPFFDEDAGNDARSLSGLLVTYRPAIDSGLTLGLSRLVMARATSNFGVLQHAFDVVLRYEPLKRENERAASGQSAQRTDQLLSLFARWVFPTSGFETYVEWSRMELPRSIREYLVAPQSTQGYTIGLQWAQPHASGSYFRVQGEVTDLEQTQVLTGRPPPDYYTGRAAVQGFTERGQLLGAASGPGSSTQFLGGDWLASSWQAGAFLGRTRTEDDAMYRQVGARATMHDVTIYSGVRGGARLPWTDVSGELTIGRRLNYLFQNLYYLGSPVIATDIQNVTLTLQLSPR